MCLCMASIQMFHLLLLRPKIHFALVFIIFKCEYVCFLTVILRNKWFFYLKGSTRTNRNSWQNIKLLTSKPFKCRHGDFSTEINTFTCSKNENKTKEKRKINHEKDRMHAVTKAFHQQNLVIAKFNWVFHGNASSISNQSCWSISNKRFAHWLTQ